MPACVDYQTTSLLSSEVLVLTSSHRAFAPRRPLLLVVIFWPDEKWFFGSGRGLLLVVALLAAKTLLNDVSTKTSRLRREVLLVQTRKQSTSRCASKDKGSWVVVLLLRTGAQNIIVQFNMLRILLCALT